MIKTVKFLVRVLIAAGILPFRPFYRETILRRPGSNCSALYITLN